MGRPGRHAPIFNFAERHIFLVVVSNFESPDKGGSRYKNLCMTRFLGFLIRYFSNYYTLHRSDLKNYVSEKKKVFRISLTC